MAMNKAILRTVRSFSARHIACRSLVTENLNKIEDLHKDSEIRVWWDVQHCKVPTDCDVGNVMRNIRDALRGIHCNGPAEFWGYGDMTLLPSLTLSDLHYGGVRLRHVPFGSELQEEVMMADMIAWTKCHPPPAVHMFISAGGEFTPEVDRVLEALDLLRVQGYHILLVQPLPSYVQHLFPQCFTQLAWQWRDFLAGPK